MALEAGSWWAVHPGTWPQRGVPPHPSVFPPPPPPQDLTFHPLGEAAARSRPLSHAGANFVLSGSRACWLAWLFPDQMLKRLTPKEEGCWTRAPPLKTQEEGEVSVAPVGDRLQGAGGWRRRSLCPWVSRASAHAHVRAHLLHTALSHALHWHMHLYYSFYVYLRSRRHLGSTVLLPGSAHSRSVTQGFKKNLVLFLRTLL